MVFTPKAGSAKAVWGSLGVAVQSSEEGIASCPTGFDTRGMDAGVINPLRCLWVKFIAEKDNLGKLLESLSLWHGS